MNGRGVTALVRGWVELYTRGLPAAIRAARCDEVDDDLWCQYEEADALGRSPRSLGGEILLRLFLGMPSDLSWRASQRGTAVHADQDRSPSMGARVIGALAIIGGVSWGAAIVFVMITGPSSWTGGNDVLLTALGLAGTVGFAGAMVGAAWLFQDQIRSAAGLAAAAGSLGIVVSAFGGYAAITVLPIASAVLVWELARIGVVGRALAVVHGLSALVFLVLLIGSQVDYAATVRNSLLVALAVPYALTWILVGASLIRGLPRVHEPAGT